MNLKLVKGDGMDIVFSWIEQPFEPFGWSWAGQLRMQVAQMTFYCIGQMQSKSNKVSPDVKARVDGIPQDLEERGITLNEVHAFEHLDDHYDTF